MEGPPHEEPGESNPGTAPDRQEQGEEQLPPGLYFIRPDGGIAPATPGTYNVGPQGEVRQAVDWQPAVEKIKWEEVTGLVESWQKRGSGARLLNLWGMYLVVALVVLVAAFLAWQRIIGGEAIAGFLGAAIGYLLSRASVEGGN